MRSYGELLCERGDRPREEMFRIRHRILLHLRRTKTPAREVTRSVRLLLDPAMEQPAERPALILIALP